MIKLLEIEPKEIRIREITPRGQIILFSIALIIAASTFLTKTSFLYGELISISWFFLIISLPLLVFTKDPLRNILLVFIFFTPFWISGRFHFRKFFITPSDGLFVLWFLICLVLLISGRFNLKNKLKFPGLFFFIVGLIWVAYHSIFISTNPSLSIYTYLTYLLPIGLAIVLMLYTSENENNLNLFIRIMFLSAIIYIPGIGVAIKDEARIKSFTEHPNILGAYFDIVIPFGVYLFTIAKSRRARIAILALICVFFYMLLKTGSRGSLIAQVLACLFALYFYLKTRYSFKKRSAVFLGGLLVFIPTLLIFAKIYMPRLFKISLVTSAKTPSPVLMRVIVWIWSFSHLTPKDIRDGMGLGVYGPWLIQQAYSNPMMRKLIGSFSHSNQLELQILFEAGLISLFLFFIFLFSLAYSFIRLYNITDDWNKKKMIIAIASAWIAVFLHGFIDYMFSASIILTQMYILLGLSWGLWNLIWKPGNAWFLTSKPIFLHWLPKLKKQ